MSLTALAPSPGLRARAAVTDAQEALRAARHAVERLAADQDAAQDAARDAAQNAGLVEELDDDLAALVAGLTQVESRASSLRLDVLAVAEQAQTARRDAATGTDAWAAALTGERREVLAGGLRIA